MMLCGSYGWTSNIFGGVTYTINTNVTDVKASTRFGWIGVFVTLDDKLVNNDVFNGGSATWFSYAEEEWGHSKADDKVKDMWRSCSRSCPLSFFSALLALLLSSATGNIAICRVGYAIQEGPMLASAALCTVCGMISLLSFGVGCYGKVTAEGVGVPEDLFEKSIGGGFIVAMIATCSSMVMTVLVLVTRHREAQGLREAQGGGEDTELGANTCDASIESEDQHAQRWRVITSRSDSKGVLVRESESHESAEIGRVMKGAVIEEVAMALDASPGGVDRIQFKLITGNGPSMGWVHTDLLEQIPPECKSTNNKEFAKQYGTELYHQTKESIAGIILSTQEMKPSSKGLAGAGIYFATTEELTGHKANAHGVILKAYVRLGKILTLEAGGDKEMTREKLKGRGYDSVCIARKVSSGQEYVVYDPHQVLYIERA